MKSRQGLLRGLLSFFAFFLTVLNLISQKAEAQSDIESSLALIRQNPALVQLMVRYRGSTEYLWATYPETDALRASATYFQENGTFNLAVPPAPGNSALPGTTPMYRLNFMGNHVFIAHAGLRNLLLSWGALDEGTMGSIFTGPGTGLVPLYSSVNPNTQVRFLTTSSIEMTAFLNSHSEYTTSDFIYSGGIAGYVLPPQLPGIKVGIMYEPWHCLFPGANNSGPVYDITQILAGGGVNWGPVFTFHWRDKPSLGYYCLTNSPDVLYQHAIMLRNAGVDFVIVDSSNNPYFTYADQHKVSQNNYWDPTVDPQVGVVQPLQQLMKVWQFIPGAPKIVPFVPTKNNPVPTAMTLNTAPPGSPSTSVSCPNPDMQVFFDSLLHPGVGAYAQMGFIYQGKPLWLATNAGIPDANYSACLNSDNAHPLYSDNEAIAAYATHYTVRKFWGNLWAQLPARGSDPLEWSFMERCRNPSFLSSGGNVLCDQWVVPGGEHISVSAAYQQPAPFGSGFMSDHASAVPKLNGNTFTQQMATALMHPEAKIVTINSWNQWGAVRFPCVEPFLSSTSTPCANDLVTENGITHGIFMDTYADDYNSDFEPSVTKGDVSYQQLKSGIAGLKGSPYKSNPATGAIVGRIDSISNNVVTGFACAYGLTTSIQVDFYIGGPYSVGVGISGVTANQTYSSSLSDLCGTSGSAHGFSYTIPTSVTQAHPGKSIYAHGTSTTGQTHFLLHNTVLVGGY